MLNDNERFANHIREYYRERLGGNYITRHFGFAAYRIRDEVLYFDEFYTERGTSFRDTFGLMRDVIKLARDTGCKHIVGLNDPSLDDYERIKKLHQYWKMYDSGQRDGHREMWVRDL
jgi:hypothetical protein